MADHDPEVYAHWDDRIVGPLHLSELVNAYLRGEISGDVKFRSAGSAWMSLNDFAAQYAPQHAHSDRIGLVCIIIPLATSSLLSVMPNHNAIDLLLALMIFVSASANYMDSRHIGCAGPPIPFIFHVLLWPAVFLFHMWHRKQHGRTGFGPIPAFAIGLLAGAWTVAHAAITAAAAG